MMDLIIAMFIGQSLLIFILLILLTFVSKKRSGDNENSDINSKDEMKRIKEEIEFEV